MTQNVRQEWRRRRRRRGKRVKPNPSLDSLLTVNTIKSPKVYCLSICKQSNEGPYSPRKPQKALLLPDLPMFLWSQGAIEHVLVSLLNQPRCREAIRSWKSASAIWPLSFPCALLEELLSAPIISTTFIKARPCWLHGRLMSSGLA